MGGDSQGERSARGCSASSVSEEVCLAFRTEGSEEWKLAGEQAMASVKAKNWQEAERHAVSFCQLRPDWPKAYLLRQHVMTHLGRSPEAIAHMLRCGIVQCRAVGCCPQLEDALASVEAERGSANPVSAAEAPVPVASSGKFRSKVKGVKLLAHEEALVAAGELHDVTHSGSSAIWLSAESSLPVSDAVSAVYRPMGDAEYNHLLIHGELPATQPYQTIVRGEEGRLYAEKYLRGQKAVDSSPTTVVEFLVPSSLVDELFAMQSKNEDGAISHGLGQKGGKGLPLFNRGLHDGNISFRVVMVKRFHRKAAGAFGANRQKL